MTLRSLIYFLFFTSSISFLSGCVLFGNIVVKKDTDQVQAKVPIKAFEDPEYAPELEKWLKKVELYNGFELYFRGYAVFMSQQMQRAYNDHLIKIQGNSSQVDEHLVVPQDKVAVFVNVFSRSLSYREFDNPKIWNFSLRYHGQLLTNPDIHRYRNSASVEPYFPMDTTWDRAYAVVFQIPKHMERDTDPKVTFFMKSGESQSEYTWDMDSHETNR